MWALTSVPLIAYENAPLINFSLPLMISNCSFILFCLDNLNTFLQAPERPVISIISKSMTMLLSYLVALRFYMLQDQGSDMTINFVKGCTLPWSRSEVGVEGERVIRRGRRNKRCKPQLLVSFGCSGWDPTRGFHLEC